MTKAVLFFNPKSWHPYSWREVAYVDQMVDKGVEDREDGFTNHSNRSRYLGLNSR